MQLDRARLFGQTIGAGSSKDWRIQFCQHLLTGGIATGAHYVIMWVALVIQLMPIVATTLGFIAGATIRFLSSYFYIFEPDRKIRQAVPRFVLVLFLQMMINAALLSLLLFLNFAVWPSQVLTTGLLLIFTFTSQKMWVFR